NGSRWWLTSLEFGTTDPSFPHVEIFVFRVGAGGALQFRQITDFSFYRNINDSALWSNDGDDSFISFISTDNGGPPVEASRLHLPAADFVALDQGRFVPAGPADCEPLWTGFLDPDGGENFYSWSPDGNHAAYVDHVYSSSGITSSTIWIRT